MDYWTRERAGAATGILAVVLIAAGGVVAGSAPGPGAGDATISAYLIGHRTSVLAASLLFGAGVTLGLWFIGSLRAALRRAEGGAGRLSSVAFAAGLAGSSFIMLDTALYATAAARAATTQPALLALLLHLAQALTIPLAFCVVALVAATSIVSERTHLFPTGVSFVAVFPLALSVLTCVGVFATRGALAPGGAVPQVGLMAATLAWVLVTSVVLVRKLGHRVETNVARRRIGDMEAGAPSGATSLYGRRTTDQD